MGILLAVMLVSSPIKEPEVNLDKKAQQAIMKFLMEEFHKSRDKANLPGCPYDEDDRWRYGLACV